MTPPWHSPSTQPVNCDTVHLLITPAVADLTHDLDHDCHYTHLHTQAHDRNRVLVEPPRDGTQSCLYHIVAAFVGQSMTQVCRDLGAWYLQPANQARLRDMLPTNLQSPAQWSRRSWSESALNPFNLADECYVYSFALIFDVSFQISVLTYKRHGPGHQYTWYEGYDHWTRQFPFRLCPYLQASRSSIYMVRGVWPLDTSIQHGSHVLLRPNCYGIQVTSPPLWRTTPQRCLRRTRMWHRNKDIKSTYHLIPHFYRQATSHSSLHDTTLPPPTQLHTTYSSPHPPLALSTPQSHPSYSVKESFVHLYSPNIPFRVRALSIPA